MDNIEVRNWYKTWKTFANNNSAKQSVNMNFVIFLILGLSSQVFAQTKDYCAASLCQNQGTHIACKNKGAFGSSCPSDKKLIDLTNFKSVVVDAHNNYRNQIATGKIPGYKPAVKMATMVWDDELAKIAALNVKTCKFEHDKCRNTDRYKTAGQNLASISQSKSSNDIKAVLNKSVQMWFEEYKKANMDYVNNFKVDSNFMNIGHFTEIIVDRNVRVGCGVVSFTSGSWKKFNVACNYAASHMPGKPLYTAGAAASKCTKGKNSKYPGLCNTSEPFNPNWW